MNLVVAKREDRLKQVKGGGQVWSFEHVIHHRLEEGGEEGGKIDDQSETTT